MRRFLYHLLLLLFLVVLNTSHLYSLSVVGLFSLLILLYLAYLAGYGSLLESIGVALVLGFLMDGFSGAPFGLYISAYVWIEIIARWVVIYLHLENPMTIRLLLISGILVEKTMHAFVLTITRQGRIVPEEMVLLILVQCIWAMLIGPFGFRMLHKLYARRSAV
ncbi:MAG: hypothetical protein AB1547_02595 [Thermodesulfobacteriota bacterium]